MTTTDDEATPARNAHAVAGRFTALPPRIRVEDTVEETDVSTPPNEPTSDPNRDVANSMGAGLMLG